VSQFEISEIVCHVVRIQWLRSEVACRQRNKESLSHFVTHFLLFRNKLLLSCSILAVIYDYAEQKNFCNYVGF